MAGKVAPHARHVEWNGKRMELVTYVDRMLFDGQRQEQAVPPLAGAGAGKGAREELIARRKAPETKEDE